MSLRVKLFLQVVIPILTLLCAAMLCIGGADSAPGPWPTPTPVLDCYNYLPFVLAGPTVTPEPTVRPTLPATL